MGKIQTFRSKSGCGTGKNTTRIPEANLGAEIERLVDASTSVNTNKLYATGIASFETFRLEYGLDPIWPRPLTHVTTFIAYLSLKNKAYNTVNCYISAINFKCKLQSSQQFSQNFLVQKMLEGLKRSKKSKDARLPISEKLLFRIINNLKFICCSKYEADLFASAFSVAFYGLLRVGELVLNKTWQAHQVIGIENISLKYDGETEVAEICLPFSKTDQYGIGTTIKIVQTNSSCCPLKLLKEYLHQRPCIKGQLYIHFGGRPVTRYQFASILNKSLQSLGIKDSSAFRTHSFRIGAASDLFEKGKSENEIMRLGRWKSNAFRCYIR